MVPPRRRKTTNKASSSYFRAVSDFSDEMFEQVPGETLDQPPDSYPRSHHQTPKFSTVSATSRHLHRTC